MKKLSLIIATIFTVLTATAANEGPAALSVTKVDATTVTVATNVTVKMDETFEIQKSTDNTNFTTIAILMGTEDGAAMPAFKMKDKIKTTAKATYYRVVKINADNTITVVSSSTVNN